MPELPEVETCRRALAPWLVGKSIRAASKSRKRLRRAWPKRFAARLVGKQILAVERQGKYILIPLDSGETLLLHLGMAGRFKANPQGKEARHSHLRLRFDDDTMLAFCDPRRFGFVDLLAPGGRAQDASLAALGLDPFATALTPAYLKQAWGKSRRAIKVLLLAQSPIAGIGNIYACEALHHAKLSPFRLGCDLALSDYDALLPALRHVLAEAINAGGSTLRDHQSPTGLSGRFQFQFQTYGRTGSPCFICQTPIQQCRQHGRSSFYCPTCQI